MNKCTVHESTGAELVCDDEFVRLITHRSADLLGVREVVFLGHPDGELSRVVGLETELVLWLL